MDEVLAHLNDIIEKPAQKQITKPERLQELCDLMGMTITGHNDGSFEMHKRIGKADTFAQALDFLEYLNNIRQEQE